MLDVATTARGDARIIAAAGEVELSSAEPLREALGTAFADATGPVVVDLRKVTFMDSSGLATLLNAQRRLTRAGRKLSLIVAPGAVARILETTRLDTTFALADTPTQALDLP